MISGIAGRSELKWSWYQGDSNYQITFPSVLEYQAVYLYNWPIGMTVASLFFPTSLKPNPTQRPKLEWIILWRYFLFEVRSYYWDLLHDIYAHSGNFSEEEQGKDARCDSKSCSHGHTISKVSAVSQAEIYRKGFKHKYPKAVNTG